MDDYMSEFINSIINHTELKTKLAMLKEFKKACTEVEFSKDEVDTFMNTLIIYIFMTHFGFIPMPKADEDEE